MFGKPAWFVFKRCGWGLTPVTWQGWVYTVVWTAVLVLPFLLLLSWHRLPEAFVWMGATLLVLFWDVATIRRAMKPRDAAPQPPPTPAGQPPAETGQPEILFLDEAADDDVSTRQYDLRVKR